MLDLCEAFKKLSARELMMRWEEYKRLPLIAKQALQTYVVVAVLLVGTLVMMLASTLGHRPASQIEPLDRLGMLIELTR